PAFVRGGTYGPWVRRTWLALAPGATGPTRARGDRPSVARPGADAGRWAASDRSEEGRRDDDDEWVGSRTGGAGPARAGFRGPQAGDERRLRGPRHGTRRGDRIRGDPVRGDRERVGQHLEPPRSGVAGPQPAQRRDARGAAGERGARRPRARRAHQRPDPRGDHRGG